MAQLTTVQSNAIMYSTYMALLLSGLYLAWRYAKKDNFLSSNGTQSALPLAVNFIAASMGCGILTTYTEIANQSGLQGLLVYTLSMALPIICFAIIGPMVRKRCPSGFVLTEWIRHRYGPAAAYYASLVSCFTMFLFMIGELSAVKQAVETLTGLNGLGAVLVECAVTTIYTAFGGFRVSFITDNLQGALVVILIIIAAAGMGSNIDVDRSLIGPSGLLKANKVGWQLVYILPVAIVCNACFLSGFWLRTFASKSTKDLWIGCSLSAFFVFAASTLVGATGFIAVWAGLLEVSDPYGYNAFFVVLAVMPRWVVGFVLVFIVCLSTCTFDSLQSAMVSTISNDVFRNRLKMIYIRGMVVIVMVPSIVLAVKVADSILQIYLIADLIAAAVVPGIFLGLANWCWFLRSFDVILGGFSGLFSVFIFGVIYYDSALEAGKLLILSQGLYNSSDWGPFGAFVVAPVFGFIFTFVGAAIRLAFLWVKCKKTGEPFTALDYVEFSIGDSDVEIDQSSDQEKTSDQEKLFDQEKTSDQEKKLEA